MADKYLKVGSTGFPTEQEAIASSAGAGDAGKIIATDGSGKLHSSFMPAGFGENTLTIEASENLAAGDFVNVFDDSGTVKVRKADNSNGRMAHGFVLAGVTAPANATVYGTGEVNDQRSSLTLGANYFLGTTGGVTTTIPSSSGAYVQYLGRAHSATALRFNESVPSVRA